jgi:hypothetical protein
MAVGLSILNDGHGFIMGKRERKNRTILQKFLSSPRGKIGIGPR